VGDAETLRDGHAVTIEVVVDDAQDARPVDVDRWSRLAQDILVAEGIVGDAELSLRFVDEGEIATLNAAHLSHEGPTDVLSFPIEDDPYAGPVIGAAPMLLGDVVICPEVAYRNAPGHAGSYDGELGLLIVHGILHLLGFDHENDAEADAMEAREQVLLEAHFAPGGGAS
jgi:probable rRNA maturation factor